MVSARVWRLDLIGLKVLEDIDEIPADRAFIENGRAILANPCNKPVTQKDTQKAVIF